jgi:hypothetical protein
VVEELIAPGITEELKRGLKEHYPYVVAPASKKWVAGASGGIMFAGKIPLQSITHMNTKPDTDKFDLLLKTTEIKAFPIDDPNPFTGDALNNWHRGKTQSGKPDHVLFNPRGTGTTIVRQTIQRVRKEYEGKSVDLSDHYGLVADILLEK